MALDNQRVISRMKRRSPSCRFTCRKAWKSRFGAYKSRGMENTCREAHRQELILCFKYLFRIILIKKIK
jgi:hypothetical protein